jgi:hypothetical protein
MPVDAACWKIICVEYRPFPAVFGWGASSSKKTAVHRRVLTAVSIRAVPQWASNDLVRPLQDNANKFLGSTAVIILTTPYCIGTLLAMFFNAIIPYDEDEEPETQEEEPLKPSLPPPSQYVPTMAPLPIMYGDPVMSGFAMDPMMSGYPMGQPMGLPMQQPMGGFA